MKYFQELCVIFNQSKHMSKVGPSIFRCMNSLQVAGMSSSLFLADDEINRQGVI